MSQSGAAGSSQPALSAGSQRPQALPTHCSPAGSPRQSASTTQPTHAVPLSHSGAAGSSQPALSAGSQRPQALATHCSPAGSPRQSASATQATHAVPLSQTGAAGSSQPALSAGSQSPQALATHCSPAGSPRQSASATQATQAVPLSQTGAAGSLQPALSAGSQSAQSLPTHSGAAPPQSPSTRQPTHCVPLSQIGAAPPHPASSAGSQSWQPLPTHCGIPGSQSPSTAHSTQPTAGSHAAPAGLPTQSALSAHAPQTPALQSGVAPPQPALSAGSHSTHRRATHCSPLGLPAQPPSLLHCGSSHSSFSQMSLPWQSPSTRQTTQRPVPSSHTSPSAPSPAQSMSVHARQSPPSQIGSAGSAQSALTRQLLHEPSPAQSGPLALAAQSPLPAHPTHAAPSHTGATPAASQPALSAASQTTQRRLTHWVAPGSPQPASVRHSWSTHCSASQISVGSHSPSMRQVTQRPVPSSQMSGRAPSIAHSASPPHARQLRSTPQIGSAGSASQCTFPSAGSHAKQRPSTH